MFSVRTLNCQLQKHFLSIGTIAATRKAITRVSKNARADGSRLPRNSRQLKGNQKIEKNKIKENTIWPYPAYENGCNCNYRHSGTGSTFFLSGARGKRASHKAINLYYLLSIKL